MDTQTLSLDQTCGSLHWVSVRPPDLHVRWILFHIPRRNDLDHDWVGRLMPAALMFECRMTDSSRPGDHRTTKGGVRMDALIVPWTMQPLFDIDKHWQFQAPSTAGSNSGSLRWETRLWLEGFELHDSESATLMLRTNAQLVADIPGLPPSISAARLASLQTGRLKDRRS